MDPFTTFIPTKPKNLNEESMLDKEKFEKNWKPSEFCIIQNKNCLNDEWCNKQRTDYNELDEYWNTSLDLSGKIDDNFNKNAHQIHPVYSNSDLQIDKYKKVD